MALYIFKDGNILDDVAPVHVVPVNCVGVMGAGLAKAYAQAYPECIQPYKAECEQNLIRPGRVRFFRAIRLPNIHADQQKLCFFPTKRHWRDESRLIDIFAALGDLAMVYSEPWAVRPTAIAMPALGCGLGGLPFEPVEALIRQWSEWLPEIDVRLYAPRAE